MNQPFFAQVIQESSSLNSPQAALKCLLLGYDIDVSSEQLAVIPPNVDAYALAQMASDLGLEVELEILPVDYFGEPHLPALVSFRSEEGAPHFVVVWNKIGPFFQIMDPQIGRRWLFNSGLQNALYPSESHIEGHIWRQKASFNAFCSLLGSKLMALDMTPEKANISLQRALEDKSWQSLARLDAAVRMASQMVLVGALKPGDEAEKMLERLLTQTEADSRLPSMKVIPEAYWRVLPVGADEANESQRVMVRGVRVVYVHGVKEGKPQRSHKEAAPTAKTRASDETLWHYLKADGLFVPLILSLGAALTAGGVVFLVLLFYAFLQLDEFLITPAERLLAISFLLGFILSLPLLQWPTYLGALRLGRRLETRLRLAILAHSSHLPSDYVQEKSIADLTERIHSVADVRYMPLLAVKAIQLFFESSLIVIGIAMIDFASLPFALLTLIVPLARIIITQPLLGTRYLRLREYLGRLSRFYLDGLLGLVAIRTHGAERNLKLEYEKLLLKWARDKLALHRIEVYLAYFDVLLYRLMSILLLFVYMRRGGEIQLVLLLLYWTLRLSYVINDLLPISQEYLNQQSKIERFLEPLKLREQGEQAKEQEKLARVHDDAPAANRGGKQGMKIELRNITIQKAENTILSDVNLTIEAGEQIAIVGRSGAGKSTLVGLLLGWYQAVSGELLIDDQRSTSTLLEKWRHETAWLDPSIQLWNRSLLENLKYGGHQTPLSIVIEQADLMNILERLPNGLQTHLGEGGRLVSGGQGQRVRYGRAMGRKNARLVILDEPFRGLDHDKRYTLLKGASAFFKNATLICITHDIGLIQSIPTIKRVLVVEEGKIIEDGAPEMLLAQPSHYQALLQAEETVRKGLFRQNDWRSLWLEGGQLSERSPTPALEAKKEPTPSPSKASSPPLNKPNDPKNNDLPSWPLEQLDQALRLLAQKSRIRPQKQQLSPPYEGQGADRWIESLAEAFSLESQRVKLSYSELDTLLKQGGPALLRLPNQRFIALLKADYRGNKISLIEPTGKVKRIKRAQIRDALWGSSTEREQINQLLTQIKWAEERQERAAKAILEEQLQERQIEDCWLLHLSQKAPLSTHLSKAKGYLWRSIALDILGRLFHFASWGIIGQLILIGHIEWSLLFAWALLSLSVIPTLFAQKWQQKLFALHLAIVFKRRLFEGALKLAPDDIQKSGAGQFLGWVLDSEALEESILLESPSIIRSIIELLIALALLLVSIPLGGIGLFCWLLLMALISWRFLKHEMAWKRHYLRMTNDLVERMIGHQTRLVQETQKDWHEEEDKTLAHYESLSKKKDQFEARLLVLIPYGWLVLGLIGISYDFITEPQRGTLAVSFLAILTAFEALKVLAQTVRALIRGITSYQEVQMILQAAEGKEKEKERRAHQSTSLSLSHTTENLRDKSQAKPKLILDARQLTFRYQPQQKAILEKCHLRIAQGERLLLEGPSGGGKSTLAALLAGLRQPNTGTLLLHGLDWHTIGLEKWRQRIVYAPQFHENHILNGTLAFNLLMGRRWPPTEEDLADAEIICRELGLGILLDKMPWGLNQQVGETGWHLSHGERSRIYIARALLQQAELVILDESFGALDPENMEIALRTVLKQAPTLLVIAHP